MTNIMEYEGYEAEINYSAEDNIFIGHILDLGDVVVFEGKSIAQLNRAFKTTVKDYEDLCERLGK